MKIPGDFTYPKNLTQCVKTVFDGEYDFGPYDARGKRALDIGANVGSFTRWAGEAWGLRQKDVTGYEPNPGAADLYARHCPDAVLVKAAVTSKPGPLPLYLGEDWGYTSIDPGLNPRSKEAPVMVPTVHPLDLPPCEIMKLDCEGPELEILRGYPHLSGVELLLFEWHRSALRLPCEDIAINAGFTLIRSHRFGTHNQEEAGLQIWRRTGEPPTRVTVVSTGFKAPGKKLCLQSVARQAGVEVEHVYVEASEQAPPKTVTENQREAIAKLADDRIVALVDGDDWLADRHVLMHVAALHRGGALVTYGQYMTTEGKLGHCAPYPGSNYRRQPWLASHLKTFRAGLYKRIRSEDLDGLRGAHDVAAMIPMLEMAGPDRVVFVPHVQYVYSIASSLERTRPEAVAIERTEEARVRAMPAYERITL